MCAETRVGKKTRSLTGREVISMKRVPNVVIKKLQPKIITHKLTTLKAFHAYFISKS